MRLLVNVIIVGALYYLLMSKFENLSIAYMLVGPAITGLSGGFATIIMATFRYGICPLLTCEFLLIAGPPYIGFNLSDFPREEQNKFCMIQKSKNAVRPISGNALFCDHVSKKISITCTTMLIFMYTIY